VTALTTEPVYTVLSSQIPDRELARAASQAGLTDAGRSQVARYCVLRLAGYSHEDARTGALGNGKPAPDGEEDRDISVRMPEHWVRQAREKYPDLTPAELLRYSILTLAGTSHERAMELSRRVRGRGHRGEIPAAVPAGEQTA